MARYRFEEAGQMAESIYHVRGTVIEGATGETIQDLQRGETVSFVAGAQALSKTHAAELVAAMLEAGGYRGPVVSEVVRVSGGSHTWGTGRTVLYTTRG